MTSRLLKDMHPSNGARAPVHGMIGSPFPQHPISKLGFSGPCAMHVKTMKGGGPSSPPPPPPMLVPPPSPENRSGLKRTGAENQDRNPHPRPAFCSAPREPSPSYVSVDGTARLAQVQAAGRLGKCCAHESFRLRRELGRRSGANRIDGDFKGAVIRRRTKTASSQSRPGVGFLSLELERPSPSAWKGYESPGRIRGEGVQALRGRRSG